MSLHIKLSPEAQAKLNDQKRNSKIASLIISFLVITVILLSLGVFLLPVIMKESPTIVTYAATVEKVIEDKPKQTTDILKRKPSAPSSSVAPVIASSAPAAESIPVPDVEVVESVDFGDSNDFGSGWGEGMDFGGEGESGAKGSAKFFNQSVRADRIAYVIDYSLSMRGEKDDLMRSELTKSMSELKSGMTYQMIFFSGPAWVAGSKSVSESEVVGADDKIFKWNKINLHVYEPDGEIQQAEWLKMNSKNRKKTLEIITDTRLVGGTDWRHPIEMALAMKPAPQIIFFMTDGASGGQMAEIVEDLSKKAKMSKTIINTVAMMEPKANEHMFNLANNTGGSFTIVELDGTFRLVESIPKEKK